MSAPDALRATSVSKTFGNLKAVDDVSVEIGRGEIVGVIGPNGSGKTTFLNLVTGVVKADSGTVTIGEVVCTGRRPHQIAQSGLARTFQTIRLFDDMTVRENLAVAAAASPRVHGSRDRDLVCGEILAELGLAATADVVATTLPYGLQRRVELARAVASRPYFLLLDEPAAGLNETESDELLTLILRLRETRDVGVVVIEHDLRLLLRAADRVVVLNEGRLLAEGTPAEVRQDRAVVAAYLGPEYESL